MTTNVDTAIERMLDAYAANRWFVDEHWPVCAPHVLRFVTDLEARLGTFEGRRVLDVGCFNGFMSYLFAQLGCEVVAVDADYGLENAPLLERVGVTFREVNLNELEPLRALPSDSFDIVIITQVIEHILNHPLGLMRDIARTLTPGGLVVLTTPNPATVLNAVRLLRGRYSLWGTKAFIEDPKMDAERVITRADIHYREYTRDELALLLEGAGLRVEKAEYLGTGVPKSEARMRRWVKRSPLFRLLESHRVFASNHYLLARR